MDEELYELPKGWVWVELRDISLVITKGSTPTTYGYSYQQEGIKFIKTENFDASGKIKNINDYISEDANKFLSRSILQEYDVLFSIAGTIGRVGIINHNVLPANTNQALAIIRCSWDFINYQYLFYFLKSPFIQDIALKSVVGVGRANVSLTSLGGFLIPFPPLPEQLRIVDKIEEIFTELDAGVELLKKLKVKLKRYRQAVLKSAVEGNLTKEWRTANQGKLEPASILLERILKQRREKWEAEQLAKMKAQGKTPKDDSWKLKYKEPIAPDTSELPELPDGWCWASLEAVADAMGGYAFKSQDYSENGCQILKIGNVKPGKISLDDKPSFIKQVDEEIKNKYLLNENDIVITLTGTRNKRDYGFVAIVNHHGNLLLNQRVARLRFNEFLNINFFSLALQSKFFQDNFFKHETGNVGQGNVGMNAITKELIFIPSILEQDKIFEEVERLFSVIDQLEKTIDANLKRAEKLRQSILKQAFEGKLVPQDPNDEPAEKLLERIKAEKAKQTTTKTKKKTQSKKQSDFQLEIPLK
jgi:type I restriction enzyme S subunit